MIVNRQKSAALNLAAVQAYVRRLQRTLRLCRRDFNVCFVDDREIQRLNAAYRGKSRPTDVLSFPWKEAEKGSATSRINGDRSPGQVALPRAVRGRPDQPRAKNGSGNGNHRNEFEGFLGDVVISVETARGNARAKGQSSENEIRWLILHGLLHLMGYDHHTDKGEMTDLELSLRAKLGL